MHNATDCFVVLSPACEWWWKQIPSEWVVRLVQILTCASWIAFNPVYLTCVSMVGMSSWEMCAKRLDLFAAIASVAPQPRPRLTGRHSDHVRERTARCGHDEVQADRLGIANAKEFDEPDGDRRQHEHT